MAIEHADFEGIERLALVLGQSLPGVCSPCLSICLTPCVLVLVCLCLVGGEIVSTFGNPEKVRLGHCKLIEEVMIGEDKVRQWYMTSVRGTVWSVSS